MPIAVDWEPQPKQLEFLRACGASHPFEDRGPVRPAARCVGYGGAAGGGKSDALLVLGMVIGLTYPGCAVGFFRRTYPELDGAKGAIARSLELMSGWANWNGGRRRWTLPTGSTLHFCHCNAEADVYEYQSQQFDAILLDEATHFTEFQRRYLQTRNRATVDGLTPLMAMGTNPGNVGHLWYKREFVEPGPAGRVHEVEIEGKKQRHLFIQARLEDNRILEERDPEYRATLETQPDQVRRALLEGDWDIFVGQVFSEWRRDLHVVEPFEIPAEWPRWRAVDWGYSAPWCCLWLARDPDSGQTVVYREAYAAGLTDPEQAERIAELSAGTVELADGKQATEESRIEATVADPSMWTARTQRRETVSTADVYKAAGVRLTPADNDRIGGLRRVRDALQVDADTGRPGLVVFEGCVNLIRTLPALTHDPVRVEDVDTGGEDHAYDALRYGLSWRVRGPRRKPDKGVDQWAAARRGRNH